METSPNSREGIEEIVTKMLAIGWDSKMKKHDGTSIVVSFTKAELCELLLNLQEQHHQELQKALEIQAIEIREEEANEYNKIIEQELQKERERCITKAWSYIVDATHAESWSRDELRKAVQSELDQPDALTK